MGVGSVLLAVVTSVLGCLLVGFAEELGTCGLVLVGARDSGFGELAAALLTMVVCSLGQAMNGLFGQSWKQTGVQLDRRRPPRSVWST